MIRLTGKIAVWPLVGLLSLVCLILLLHTARLEGQLDESRAQIEALLARPPLTVRAGVCLDDPEIRQALWTHGFYEEGWALERGWPTQQAKAGE